MIIPDFITPASLARYIPTPSGRGVTRQRTHHMVKHPQEGDNAKRIKAALAAMRDEIDNFLNS